MSNNNQSTRSSWLTIATVALLALPVLYVLSSGTMQNFRLPEREEDWKSAIHRNFSAIETITGWCGDPAIVPIYKPLDRIARRLGAIDALRRYWAYCRRTYSPSSTYAHHRGAI